MTSVSAKVPASRVNGSDMPGGGPVPVPRVVGNRRIRTGGIALATMLLAFGAALSGIALLSVSKTSSYLAISQQVPAGAQITPGDLKTVQLSGGGGLTLIPAVDVRAVVGHRAATTLEPGTLLSPTELTDAAPIGAGEAQIALTLAFSRLPTANLAPNEQITLFPNSDPTRMYDVTIINIGAPGSDGNVLMYVAVPVDDAPTIEALNEAGGLGVELRPAN
jgi:hypothetical protein